MPDENCSNSGSFSIRRGLDAQLAKWMGQRGRQRLDSIGAELRRSREDNSNRASRTA